MHEDAHHIKGKIRERSGSRYARRERDAGRLPAVVYGHKLEPLSVSLEAHETLQLIHKGEKVFQLDLEGKAEPEFVLLKDLQFDHLGTNIVHCDLERVDLDERIHVSVPIKLVGQSECKALKRPGAVLMHPLTALDLECAVVNLPDFLEVDIRDLPENGSIHAKEVTLPKKTMKLLSDPEGVVAHVIVRSGEAGGDEAAEVDGGASPEVLTEKKEG